MEQNRAFCDIYYQPGDTPVICYRSGMMVYEEVFDSGVLVSGGYNAAGYPLNVLAGYPTRLDPKSYCEPSVFHVELDGVSLDYGLRFVDLDIQNDGEKIEAVVTLESTVKPVRLKVHTLLDGTQMFTRWLEIENLSDAPMNLNRLALLSGGMETLRQDHVVHSCADEKRYSVGYFDNDGWGVEGHFNWHDLQPGQTTVESRFGRDRFRHPAVFVRNNVEGLVYFSQIGWSGGCRYSLDYNATPNRDTSHLSLVAEITSHNPMRVIDAGECWCSPEVHMGVVSGDLDDAVNQMHAHIRKSVMNAPELNPVDLSVGAGMGAEHDMSVETSKSFIRQFADMGAEVFIIDAGWECPPEFPINWGDYNGVNEPDPDRYPNGLAELSDYCHEYGMKFAMWIEIERLGEYAPALAEHPEWIAKDAFGKKNGGYIDFTNPEAAAWAESELARMIEEYRLDLLRIDYNVSFRDYFAFGEPVKGKRECLSLRHTDAVYRMYRNLKRRFPHVVFENCAGGGGRTDLGMMKNFNHTWVSDCQRAPRSLYITNGMTMVLPPERVDRLFAGMGCHEHASFDMHMRNTMLTHMSLNVIAPTTAMVNPKQMAFVRHSVEIYKNFIRGILPTALSYHHTPETSEAIRNGFLAQEIASPDKQKGAVVAYTLPCVAPAAHTLHPKGVDAAKTYRVTFDNSGATVTVSGYELMTNGIRIAIPAALSSELVLYEAIEA
ncbi:MAG: alpha-galactosidase [Clostridia bacterium]|nr:alpha-galactosidase [Clostridia bacterium]